MKLFVSHLIDKRTLFFGEADSYTIISQNISAGEILRKLRVASLLYDHVILAAAYFWQSETMYSLLPSIETLMTTGEILPSIRAPRITRDVADYYEKRSAETFALTKTPIYRSSALASEIAKPQHRPIALELDKVGTVVYIDIGSVEDKFRYLWLNDTLDQRSPYSVYNTLLVASSSTEHAKILQRVRSIATRPYFSRSLVAQEIFGLDCPKEIKNTLVLRASDLYLLANAQACESDLLSTTRSLTYSEIGHYQQLLGPLATSNVDLFTRILKLCGIPLNLLNSLSNEEILLIKYSEEFYEFKTTYFKLIETALNEQDDFVNDVWQKFSDMWTEERLKKKLILFLKYIENVSSWLFAAALGAVVQQSSPFTQSLLIASGIGAGTSHILKRIEWFNKTPISDFVDFAARGEYRKRLYSSRRLIQ